MQTPAQLAAVQENAEARRADYRKAAFHAFLVVAALLEYRSTEKPFRKQLCGAWAGFHVVSVLLDLKGD